MMRNYGYGEVFFYALVIILCVVLVIGYFYVYYKCMFMSVPDLPGYCLSVL